MNDNNLEALLWAQVAGFALLALGNLALYSWSIYRENKRARKIINGKQSSRGVTDEG